MGTSDGVAGPGEGAGDQGEPCACDQHLLCCLSTAGFFVGVEEVVAWVTGWVR